MPANYKKRDRERKAGKRREKHGGPGGKRAVSQPPPPPPPSADAEADDTPPPTPPPSAVAEADDTPPPPPPSAVAEADNPADADDTPPPPPPPSAVADADNTPAFTFGDRCFRINCLSLQVPGRNLLANTSVELREKRRYALVGPNGSGKSLLLAALGTTIPIPPTMTVCRVADGVPASDLSVIEFVMGDDPKEERSRLEELIANSSSEDDKEQWRKELDRIGPKARSRACVILAGFGFNSYMLHSKVNSFSETWRMRIALARALYLRPAILLLDNPTKHLDFDACAWLEEQLGDLENTQLIVSNSESFLINVCTDVIEINMHDKKIVEHPTKGYDQYLHEKSLEKQIQGQHEGASMNTQSDKKFSFTDVATVIPIGPVLVCCSIVEYGYSKDKPIFKNLCCNINVDSKIALVGPNGSGKSTLLKILARKLPLAKTMVSHTVGLRVKYFDQHSTRLLDQEVSGIEYMKTCSTKTPSRSSLIKTASKFGLSQEVLDQRIKTLSDGQRTRLIFSAMAVDKPNLLLLDEPTSHLDSNAIDCLAEGLKKWDGAFVIAGHDIRLISLVAKDIWVCGKLGVTKRDTCNIMSYRDEMIQNAARCFVRVSSSAVGLSPLFSVGSYRNVALPFIWYNKYLDSENKCSREPTISLDRFITRRYMTASAPCNSLEEGFLQIPGEIVAGKRYRVRTEVSKKVSSSLLKALWTLDMECGFCLSDFTRENIFVTPSGEVKFRGFKLLDRTDDLVKRNISSARTILEDLFSSAEEKPPPEIGHLLDLMKDHPEKRELFHTHASHVPLSNEGEFFMRLFGCLHFTIEPTVRDRILENLPHADRFEIEVQSNILLKKYFDHNGGQRYNTHRLLLQQGQALTAEQEKIYKRQRAWNFSFYLRNRTGHRMEHFKTLFRYLGDMSDLAAHVRFPLVNCYLQEQLYDAEATRDLLLHNLIK